jgi:hypothetical protein
MKKLLWVTNTDKKQKGLRYNDEYLIKGEPKATNFHASDELKKMGIVGWYRMIEE